MSALLEVKALSAGYGRVPVLHGVDFTVEEGEIVGVLGHNGMGKTTLLKTIMGIVPATGGVIGYAGLDLTRERASERARLGLGYVPQGRGIFPNLSVQDNIRMGIAAHGGEEEEAVRRILAGFPRLEPLLDREGGALSGRRAAASRDRALPHLRARAGAPRRADGRHPALHRRRDHRAAAQPQPRAGRHHRHGGAEPRLHHRAFRPGAAAPEGGHQRRGQGGGRRGPRPHRGVHGIRRRGRWSRVSIRRARPVRRCGHRRGARPGANRGTRAGRRPDSVPRRRRTRFGPARAAVLPGSVRRRSGPVRAAGPGPQREDFLHDRSATDPHPAQGDRRGARHEHVRRPRPGVPRRDAGHPRTPTTSSTRCRTTSRRSSIRGRPAIGPRPRRTPSTPGT